MPRIPTGIRADPVHGVPPPSGVEGFPEHAAVDIPGTTVHWLFCRHIV